MTFRDHNQMASLFQSWADRYERMGVQIRAYEEWDRDALTIRVMLLRRVRGQRLTMTFYMDGEMLADSTVGIISEEFEMQMGNAISQLFEALANVIESGEFNARRSTRPIEEQMAAPMGAQSTRVRRRLRHTPK